LSVAAKSPARANEEVLKDGWFTRFGNEKFARLRADPKQICGWALA